MQLWHVSVIALSLVFVLCVVGTFHPKYIDNLGQRAGMFILALGCASRVQGIWETKYVANDWWMIHVGIAVFGISTAYRQYQQVKNMSDDLYHKVLKWRDGKGIARRGRVTVTLTEKPNLGFEYVAVHVRPEVNYSWVKLVNGSTRELRSDELELVEAYMRRTVIDGES